LRLFINIFSEVEVFDYKCEAFIKITRLFEDIFRDNKKSEAFSKILKTFSTELRLFRVMFFNLFPDSGGFFINVGLLKDFEAFKRHFHRSEGFFKLMLYSLYLYEDFIKITTLSEEHCQRNGSFCLEVWGFYKDFNYF
jgi:hypothetical protein